MKMCRNCDMAVINMLFARFARLLITFRLFCWPFDRPWIGWSVSAPSTRTARRRASSRSTDAVVCSPQRRTEPACPARVLQKTIIANHKMGNVGGSSRANRTKLAYHTCTEGLRNNILIGLSYCTAWIFFFPTMPSLGNFYGTVSVMIALTLRLITIHK